MLARDTGARALGVPRLDALPALYAEIDTEVRHLYRIGYMSNDERRDGQWRTVSVRVRSRDANVRARAGYYASRLRVAGAQAMTKVIAAAARAGVCCQPRGHGPYGVSGAGQARATPPRILRTDAIAQVAR